MRYILLGKLNKEWITREERVNESKAKMNDLGIELEAIHYTQGPFDFVDIVSTNNPEAALTFSVWYAAQGYGNIMTLPSFTPEAFSKAIANA
ncbi:MAG: GYD domain-containing protein [Planctomycetota bacterium]|jgi:uncharacterized protein with GYD domain